MSVVDASLISESTNIEEVRTFINELLESPECPVYTMNMEQLDGYYVLLP